MHKQGVMKNVFSLKLSQIRDNELHSIFLPSLNSYIYVYLSGKTTDMQCALVQARLPVDKTCNIRIMINVPYLVSDQVLKKSLFFSFSTYSIFHAM